MQVFLSGPMGVGKSTVAAEVARRLGARSLDLDAAVEREAGCSVAELFRDRGEPAFRELERELALRVAREGENVVVALGGGTVADPAVRRELLERGVLVTLTAPVEELVARVGQDAGRPLLAGSDPGVRLRALLEVRAEAYAECHASVPTAGRTVAQVAEAVEQVARRPSVVVPLGTRTYRVEIGSGVRRHIGSWARSERPVLVTDSGARAWAEGVGEALSNAGATPATVVLEAGEEHKTIRSVERIWDAALEAGIDRQGIVVGVGGGVVGDLAAFAASTLLRGVSLGQVPTTLLAMVDSSVGGKTGFDRPQGKNLIGTFHQPSFVLCDVETLQSLPEREWIAGMAEVVKSAWLDGPEAVAMLERDAEALRAREPEAVTRAIGMSVRLKARIVTQDEREQGARMLLNLGHTIGHGLEAAGGYRSLRHGEAVALGMVAAFRVGRALGYAGAEDEERARAVLLALGLGVDLDAHLDARTFTYVGADKKRRGAGVRFVVPGPPGRTEVVPIELGELPKLVRSSAD